MWGKEDQAAFLKGSCFSCVLKDNVTFVSQKREEEHCKQRGPWVESIETVKTSIILANYK